MSKKSKKKALEEEEKTSKAKKKGTEKDKKSKKAKRAESPKVTREQRLEMIATAAYYIAERHGFTPGESQADWRAAEKEVDAMLKQKRKKKTKD
jgi:hypothetical protein